MKLYLYSSTDNIRFGTLLKSKGMKPWNNSCCGIAGSFGTLLKSKGMKLDYGVKYICKWFWNLTEIAGLTEITRNNKSVKKWKTA